MGFNLRQKLEETFADVNPFDNGATAQTVRAKRTKAAPAQTIKVQNRPQFQQNNQPVYQQQQQKQFKIQSPSLNINNSMPKVQTFGQSDDPLKVGQVKTPQIQTPQKAPMMLTTQGQQQWRQKQPINPATIKPTPIQKSQVSGISDQTWNKMGQQDRTNLRVQEHKTKQKQQDVWNPFKIGGDIHEGVVKPIVSSVVDTVKLPGDLIAGGITNATGSSQQKKAAGEQIAQHFNNSIPGQIYRPMNTIGNVTAATLYDKAHPDSKLTPLQRQIKYDAMNQQTAHTGITTDISNEDAARKIAGAYAETG